MSSYKIQKEKEQRNIFKVTNPKTEFKCKYPGCNQTFKKLQGLGGHTSKSHPNTSSNYANKVQIRKDREDVRLRNQHIKEILIDDGV